MTWSTTATLPQRQDGPAWTTSAALPTRQTGVGWFSTLEKVAQFSATGSLSANVATTYPGSTVAFSSIGALSATVKPVKTVAAAFTATGTLAGAVNEIKYVTAAFSATTNGVTVNVNDGLWATISGGAAVVDGLSATISAGAASGLPDPFTRADSTTSAGPGWTNRANTMGVTGNNAYPVSLGAWCVASWSIPMSTDDTEASITLGTLSGSNDYAMAGIGFNTAGEGVFADVAAYDGHFHIYSVTDWAFGGLVDQANGGGGWTTGDVLKLKRVGNVYTVYLNGTSTGVTWTDSGNVIPRDSSHRYVAMGSYDDGSGHRRIDSFDAGGLGPPPVTAGFTGTGTLNATTLKVGPVAAALTATGLFAADTFTPVIPIAAALSGAGTLSVATTGQGVVAADFTSSGALAAIGTQQYAATAALTAAATLSATVAPQATVTAALSGTGALSATVVPVFTASATLSSTGTLSATATTQYAPTATLTATGTLAATMTAILPVAFDSVGVGKGQQTTALSWTHTIGATANALVVCVAHYGNTTTPTLTATCGATSMTLLGSRLAYHTDSFGHYAHMAVYGLLNPPTGAQTITANTNGTSIWSVGDSTAYTNVTSFGTVVTNSATGTAMTQAVTSATNQMCVQAFASGITSATISAYNRTSRFSKAYTNTVNVAFQMGDTAVVSPSFTATLSPSTVWASVAVPLVP